MVYEPGVYGGNETLTSILLFPIFISPASHCQVTVRWQYASRYILILPASKNNHLPTKIPIANHTTKHSFHYTFKPPSTPHHPHRPFFLTLPLFSPPSSFPFFSPFFCSHHAPAAPIASKSISTATSPRRCWRLSMTRSRSKTSRLTL